MVQPVSILEMRVAGTSRVKVDVSTGQTMTLDLPSGLTLDANLGVIDDLKRVLQTILDLGNDPQPIFDGIRNVPIRSFDGKTVLEMIEAGRTDDVVHYMKSLSAGFVG
jgi:hypothetical protein